MKLKTRLTGIAAAVAVALPLMAPAAAFAQTPAPKCIFLANGSGISVCYTPLLGTEVAGIQIDGSGGASLPMTSIESAGVQFSPVLGPVETCLFNADQPSVQLCAA
jgi:hypothetical protein